MSNLAAVALLIAKQTKDWQIDIDLPESF